jgi:DNA-binding PadR family transcriptional regulator
MKQDNGPHLPLSPAALQILLALAGQDLHGYGIIQQASRQSQGQVRIGPGTLYDNLRRFMNQGLVSDLPAASADDKRLYSLTAAGRNTLSAEITRLEQIVREAKRLRNLKPRRA